MASNGKNDEGLILGVCTHCYTQLKRIDSFEADVLSCPGCHRLFRRYATRGGIALLTEIPTNPPGELLLIEEVRRP